MYTVTKTISRGNRAPISASLAVQSAEGKFTTLFTTYPRLHTQTGVHEEALFFLAPRPTLPDKKLTGTTALQTYLIFRENVSDNPNIILLIY